MNLSASNEGQSHCGTKASSQATFYRISRAIVPNVVCPNDLRISDKISFISDENRWNEPRYEQNYGAVLIG